MKRIYIFLLIAAFAIQSCSKQEGDNKIAQKKEELAKSKKEMSALKDKIIGLEKEIAKLEGKENASKGKAVAVQVIAKAPFNHYIEVQGRVESDQNIIVSAEAPGTITTILVHEGQSVKKGQLLAQVEASTLATQIQGAKTQVEFSKTLYEKQKRLREQNVGTEVGLLQAKAQYDGAVSQLETLERQLSHTRITSPINGIVDSKMITSGAVVGPGSPAFRVVGGSEYKVVARIADTYLSNVKNGQSVIVYFPDTKKELKGTISNLSRIIDPSSRTFAAEIKIANSEDIRPNMVSVVKIQDYQSKNTIIVPVNSVQSSDEGDFVLVAKEKDGRFVASKKIITKGSSYGGKAEVLQGLTEGDKVIVTGYQDLVDDQPVKIKQ